MAATISGIQQPAPSAAGGSYASWRLLVDAGVRPIRLHDMRHTRASPLLAQGAGAGGDEVLGHSHVMPSALHDAADAIDRVLGRLHRLGPRMGAWMWLLRSAHAFPDALDAADGYRKPAAHVQDVETISGIGSIGIRARGESLCSG